MKTIVKYLLLHVLKHPAFARNSFFILALFLGSCNAFEFSPNQTSDRNSPVNLNEKNIAKLGRNADDTVTIAFTGDSQRFYAHIDRFVKKANTLPEIDFILLAGDISDFGLLQEFEWVNSRLAKLSKPYIGVIGNHDLVANGEVVFEKMFGPLNLSFVYDSIRFVTHNTNSLEYKFRKVPDMNWLGNALKPAANVKHIVTVSHVPPFSPDEFNTDLEGPYTRLLSQTPNLLVSLHGHVHEHRDFYPYDDHVRYITSYAYEQDAFVLLKIVDGKVLKSIIDY
ncbi:3',5'-cyclic adenosine monophosphate phosphodiesterase CpdA [Dyadobacter sp. CECT 9275]|uniref:3',5'-cyclic adenosine monophosphate phosphodiesterase CpdA n=1 Tax=Dyadobacter helix TaxID=2822344 RepID=A0A916J9X5_9BACT|nr:metallophosphoesterase [Dyadobacter sp. CECT 9275]CAG4994181.1 3',5'-cyclic adenosine monophosphate phosphodiesterase CpdA [Dyadobacter sp. CECT 9275]